MTRAEVYAKIKEYELQEVIKEKYGFNYTNLSTATLIAEVTDYEETRVSVNTPKESREGERLTTLIELLYKKHILCKHEYEAVMA